MKERRGKVTATHDYLAFDLGATSGRAIIGRFDGARLTLHEAHRFANGPITRDGHRYWDWPRLGAEVETGLARAAAMSSRIVSVSCDSWGLDHGFLDRQGHLLELPFSYQDGRTRGIGAAIEARIDPDDLFGRGAAPCAEISTLAQLLATRRDRPELLEQADHFNFISGLALRHLSGVSATDRCMASTSQLYSWEREGWDAELIGRMELPGRLFPPLRPLGEHLGGLAPDLRQRLALPDWDVRLTAGHDTALAWAAAPLTEEGDLALSSGTWSMLGLVVPRPIVTSEARRANCGSYAIPGPGWSFMRGIMGLWLLERYRREEPTPDRAELDACAAAAPALRCLFNPADAAFGGETPFTAALARWARNSGQPMPEGPGAIARCILESLALFFDDAIGSLERLAGRPVRRIVIVGGGSRNRLLNQLTANATGRPVLAGAAEATVVGNLLTQAVGRGDLASLDELRTVATRSFPAEPYEPQDPDRWREARAHWARFKETPD